MLSLSLFLSLCLWHTRTDDAHENLNPPIICCSRKCSLYLSFFLSACDTHGRTTHTKISILLYVVVDSALSLSLFLSLPVTYTDVLTYDAHENLNPPIICCSRKCSLYLSFFLSACDTHGRTTHTKISILLYVVVDSALSLSFFLCLWHTRTFLRTTHTKISILLLYVVVDSALSISLSFFLWHTRTDDAHENLNPPIICCSS